MMAHSDHDDEGEGDDEWAEQERKKTKENEE
jgi:hypothetical protein